jgi:hypothetical protein
LSASLRAIRVTDVLGFMAEDSMGNGRLGAKENGSEAAPGR